MFDTHNDFDFKINAVSGTLRKSHPKSKFCVRGVDDGQCVFADSNPRLTRYSCDIVLLQIMLTGENRVLIEYVDKSDFELSEDNDNAKTD